MFRAAAEVEGFRWPCSKTWFRTEGNQFFRAQVVQQLPIPRPIYDVEMPLVSSYEAFGCTVHRKCLEQSGFGFRWIALPGISEPCTVPEETTAIQLPLSSSPRCRLRERRVADLRKPTRRPRVVPHCKARSRSNVKPQVFTSTLSLETREASSPGSERNESHESSHLLSHRHLHRPRDNMKLPKFLRPPKIHRRNRSKARSEIGPVEGQNEVDQATPRPTESTPDLRAGTSILPTPGPSTSRNQESSGMETILFRLIHLSSSLYTPQIPIPAPTESNLPREKTRPCSPSRKQRPSADRIGSPPRMLQPS